MKVSAMWTGILLCIWKVPDSNLSKKINYPDQKFLFLESFQAIAGIVP
jgi:hypothetical protein